MNIYQAFGDKNDLLINLKGSKTAFEDASNWISNILSKLSSKSIDSDCTAFYSLKVLLSV